MKSRQILTRKTTQIPEGISPERIVQFGAGNFIRAFADWIIQELNEQTDFDSSVVVVKVTPNGTYAALDAQDGLFHVHTEGIQYGEFVSLTKLITCISRIVYPYLNQEVYLELARQPNIRFLISNTTEAGIVYNENDALTDTPPSSFPAKLTQFLYTRYQHFSGAMDKGCIVLPTELVVDNGSKLREMILQYAEQWSLDNGFAAWVEQHNVFCNTLVDRIVPGYPTDKADDILDTIGFDDDLLVMGEQYHSLVIEAPQSIQDELPFHETTLNIKIVDDIDRYRQVKVRILNGLHTSMVMMGLLLDISTVRESIEHSALGQFLRDEALKEIIPSMDFDDNELQKFAADVFDRFANPAIHHQLMSIALNSSTKVRTRILPTIIAYQAKFGTLPPRAVLAFAGFIRLYKGDIVSLNDDEKVIQWFSKQWRNCESVEDLVTTVLQRVDLWETDLLSINGLHQQLCENLVIIENGQLESTIESLNR